MEQDASVRILFGHGIGSGIGVGRVLHMAPPLPEPDSSPLAIPPAKAWLQVQQATEHVASRFEEAALEQEGEPEEILLASSLIARDPAILEDVKARIKNGHNPERAVHDAFVLYRQKLIGLGGKYAERASDLDDVCQRIRAHIAGVPVPGVPDSDEPFVLVAKDLAPADTATLDFNTVQALITEGGGPTGHTAILARSKAIPTIIGCAAALEIPEGSAVIVDSGRGEVVVDASREEIEDARERTSIRAVNLARSKGPGVFKGGRSVQLLANLGSISETGKALDADAEGVGLFRTEFLFIGTTEPPSREVQARAYRDLLSKFAGKKVVVRLLDAGADKPLPYLSMDNEANPALGVRGYRTFKDHEAILETQLLALADAQADTDADLWVMAPMIADEPETKAFVEAGRKAGLRTLGVMAEVPAIAVVADQVAKTADFISVGTNDLTQYALAADRTAVAMSEYQNPWHPAVLRLVRMLGEAVAREGKDLGVCGEAASDPDLAAVIVGLGADSLSMAPDAIPEVRLALAEVTYDQAREAAQAACQATNAREAKDAATAILRA